MSTFIIADLHLSETEPLLTNALSNFYERMTILNDRVIIAGDLFDFFVGVDKDSSLHQRVRQIIMKANERGVKTLFQAGNRDFLMNSKAAAYFGMKLIGDFYLIHTIRGNALILHGDQLCLHQRGYQSIRTLCKNPVIRKLFMMLPLSFKTAIAKKLRAKSLQQHGDKSLEESKKALTNPKVKSAGALFALKSHCTLVIHGHFHVFGAEQDAFGPGITRLGLGMWDSNFSYIKIDHTDFKLIQRPMEKNF